MEQMTQTNAASAEASATAGEALNTQARCSLHTVEQLERQVGVAAPAADAPTRRRTDADPPLLQTAA
jgi:hypothetical protein